MASSNQHTLWRLAMTRTVMDLTYAMARQDLARRLRALGKDDEAEDVLAKAREHIDNALKQLEEVIQKLEVSDE